MQDEETFTDQSTTGDIFSQQAKTLRAHRDRAVTEPVTEALPPQTAWYSVHLYHIGMWMIAMFFLYLFIASVVAPIYANVVDQWNYGQARISQFDFNVGHNGTSHFIAEYYQKQAIVIELPQDHPERVKVYTLRMSINGTNSSRIVTLQATHINLHGKIGYPDLIVQVEGFALPAILYNTGTGFSQEQ